LIEKLGETFLKCSDAVDEWIELLGTMLLEFSSEPFNFVAQVYGQLFDLLALPVGVFLQIEPKFLQVNFFSFGADLLCDEVNSDQNLSDVDVGRITFALADVAHSLDHALESFDLILSIFNSRVGLSGALLKRSNPLLQRLERVFINKMVQSLRVITRALAPVHKFLGQLLQCFDAFYRVVGRIFARKHGFERLEIWAAANNLSLGVRDLLCRLWNRTA